MSTNPLVDAFETDPEAVFGALTREPCRDVIRALDRPMTATAVAEACDVPRSTAYQKLEEMVEAGLLRKHESGESIRYSLDFEEIVVRNSADGLELSITPPSRSAAEQLSELWGEVRSETGRE
ncbi:DUF7342 family protein [Halobellus sp. GM3]|uniref:DUF7342 family protein n=1 Tax=Halobellus sp. GM3 TaxID=3458410 RepID=UPI00403D7131